MAAAPWFLLALGILIVIAGFFLAVMRRPGSGGNWIDPRMSDEEVSRKLRGGDGDLLASIVMVVGFALVLISIVWRIVRAFI